MQRRKYIAALASLAAGGAVIGTGAFSTASAERSTTVQVRSDSNAYLGISGDPDYTSETSGTLEINFDGNGQGSGINGDADSEFTDLLTVTNQGTELVLVWVNLNDLNDEMSSGLVTAYLSMQDNELANGSGSGMDGGDGIADPGEQAPGTSGPTGVWGVFIPPGESVDIALQFQSVPEADIGAVYDADVGIVGAAEDSEMFGDVVAQYSFPNDPSRPYVP